jgi:hypothetical protein
MSQVNITLNTNTIEVNTTNNQIVVTDPTNPTTVNVVQPVTTVVEVITPGPQGPQGPPGTGSIANTGSFVTTSSFNAFTSSYTTGSFTGSFTGDGSGLTNLPVQNINTSSFATTGSNTFIGNQVISGSLNVSGSITGSLFGTASFATSASRAISSSFAISASWAPMRPGGLNTQIQYNNNGVLAGNSTFTFSNILESIQQGNNTQAIGNYSHAEGFATTASGQASHAEGERTRAIGASSHAEGDRTVSSGSYSHAEGSATTASGQSSHAEGSSTIASGPTSHAEGSSTIASGSHSHAEGAFTLAIGLASHAEGLQTIALGNYQHVQGQYNISSSAQSAFIIGNGTDIVRSNLVFASGTTFQVTGSLNVSGSITGSLFGTSSVSTNIVVTDDTATDATYYLILSPSSSGAVGARVDSTTLTYNPFTDTLTTGDLTLAAGGSRTITMQAQGGGGTEINLQPNSTAGYARINVGNTNQPLDFQMNSVDVMRITQAGDVGIGTLEPNAKLDVNGNVIITGSLAQGLAGNIATGPFSHAEGSITKALGEYSHAEGDNTQATGNYSHAEGQETVSSGNYSHAEGYGTTAEGSHQHVQGQYNISSPVQSAFIHGNGTDDGNRSNLIYAHDSIVEITGSLTVTQGITGSLFGTASWATNAITATTALNGGVTQLLAGPNVTLSPTNGLGQVTISSTSGGGGFNTATGSYGSFYSTSSQTNPVANIPRSMSLNETDITNGVSVSGSTSPFNTYIKTENAGVYNIQFSAQLDKTDGGSDEIVIWLRKNGINLTDTSTTITLSSSTRKQVAAWNWFVNSAANDYYQIIWQSADTNVRLLAEPADGYPGIPSVIVTVNRVDQFLSNTGSFSGSFTGAFSGSGANLNSIPASAITGLNLSQIATGSVTASVSPTQFTISSASIAEFTVTGTGVTLGSVITDTHTVTGSLNVTGSITATTYNNLQNSLKTFNRTQGIYYFEEFMGSQGGSTGTSYTNVVTTANGANATARSVATTNRTNQQGIIQHSTGTTTTGAAGYLYGTALYIGSGSISLETYATVETLSNATERFQTIFGYYSGSNYSNTANAIFFSYDEAGTMFFEFGAAATPNWKCYTRGAGVTTRTNSSIPVVAGTWYKLRIDINAAGNSVSFYINDTFITTHTTNIPTSLTQMYITSLMVKTAGTTARTMLTDYFMYEEIFTNPR